MKSDLIGMQRLMTTLEDPNWLSIVYLTPERTSCWSPVYQLFVDVQYGLVYESIPIGTGFAS